MAKKRIGTAPSQLLGKTTTTNAVHSKLSHVSKDIESGASKKDGVSKLTTVQCESSCDKMVIGFTRTYIDHDQT